MQRNFNIKNSQDMSNEINMLVSCIENRALYLHAKSDSHDCGKL